MRCGLWHLLADGGKEERRGGHAVVAGGSWWLGAVGSIARDARKVVRLQGLCWVVVIAVG